MTRWLLNHKKFGNKPWAVQAEALRRSAGHDRYGYYLEQGLGKTALTLNDFVADDDVDVMLTVAPNSMKLDWTLAPEAWGFPDIPTGYWPKHPIPVHQDKMVYSINYEAARDAALDDLVKLCKRRRVLLNLDETSTLKHFDSATSRAALALSKVATKVRLLNGTPQTQTVMDHFIPLKCLNELDGWKPASFRGHFAEMKVGFKGKKKISGQKNVDELAAILDRCTFRALKEDWRKDLPPRVFVPVHLEMTARQRKHYEEMADEFITVVGGIEVTANLVLTQMDKLQQLASGLARQYDKFEWVEDPRKLPKVDACLQIADGYGKTIIVYKYKPSGDMLMETFSKAGFQPAVVKGGMRAEDLKNEKERFNEDSECRVIVVQEATGCMGHDFLGSYGADRATKMAFFENSFNLRDRLQMLDRNHRGEADQECTVYDFVTSPIEQHVIDILNDKKTQADMIDSLVDAVRSMRR